MSEPLDELYLTWLYSQIGSVSLKTKSRSYWTLIRQLYQKEFVWIIPNDDNRVEDGRDLRIDFVYDHKIRQLEPGWIELGCSMLEMLVALSRRLSFEDDREPRVWFWHLLDNIDLHKCNDASNFSEKEVDEILETIIWRTYSQDGRGGLFPLKNPDRDQREVEIWYQLSAYLLEPK